MFFNYNRDKALAIIQSSLTPSQQSMMKRHGFYDPLQYLLCRPLRYIKRTYEYPESPVSDEHYALIGQLMGIKSRRIRKNLVIYSGELHMANHRVGVVWYNQPYVVEKRVKFPWVVVHGKFDIKPLAVSFNVARFDWFSTLNQAGDQRIFPQYSDIRGVSNSGLTKIIQSLLAGIDIMDPLPQDVLASEGLLPIKDALTYLHFPLNVTQVTRAIHRLAFDELFIYLFPKRAHRHTQKIQNSAIQLGEASQLPTRYMSRLTYTLTSAQRRVWEAIQQAFTLNKPVFRLIQGDVGSGKTDVAILALLAAIECGYKGAFLVPTEILAEQHWYKLADKCADFATVILLKGKQTASERRRIHAQLQDDAPLIVVGTHALIQSSVAIHNLGLVVIDEQHRFGVFQRQHLLASSDQVPHCLFMTATPIPRTLMLTHYGDLDHDIIDELPPGRKPPNTYFTTPARIRTVYEFIRLELTANRQAYVVYPLIETSEHLDGVEPAVEGFETLTHEFDRFSVGLLHGKMPPQHKQEMMDRFKRNEIQLLVSTTVIEVGVDVPNASTIVIMNAERFGLSQLHQLRGRVGRGSDQAHCFLVGDPASAESRQRIKAMQATSNGFKLAEMDLTIRGPGHLLGTQQSGELSFSFADLSDQIRIQRIITICDRMLATPSQYPLVISYFNDHQQVSATLLN